MSLYRHLGFVKVEHRVGQPVEVFLPRRDRWLQHFRIWRGKHRRLWFLCRFVLTFLAVLAAVCAVMATMG